MQKFENYTYLVIEMGSRYTALAIKMHNLGGNIPSSRHYISKTKYQPY